MKKLKQLPTWLKVVGALLLVYVVYCVGYNASHPKTPVAQPLAEAREEITPAAIYNLVNDERQKAGVPRLAMNPKLNQSAQQKCDDMVANDYYDHVNPKTGKHGYEYAKDAVENEHYVSENLNEGVVTASKYIIEGWMNSPSHKAAILDPKYIETGLAVCHRPSTPAGSVTVVQHFLQSWTAEELNALRAQQAPAQTQQPARRSTFCNTQYYSTLNSATTTCY